MENLETRGVIKWAANCKVTGLVAAAADATTKPNRERKSGATAKPENSFKRHLSSVQK